LLDRIDLTDERLWFNADIQTLGPDGFAEIRSRHPAATISCPVDFVIPLLLAAPEAGGAPLQLLKTWGVDRLSLRWAQSTRAALDILEELGWEVNLYGVPDLEAFLDASLMLPASVTADFNFPEWRYFGKGSGQVHPGDQAVR
jgi:hypothetical protein